MQVVIVFTIAFCLFIPLIKSEFEYADFDLHPEFRYSVNGTVNGTRSCVAKRSINCNSNQKYRNFNGLCNNLKVAKAGSSDYKYRRAIAPDYSSSSGLPRGGTPSALPNPRLISTTIHAEEFNPDPRFSQMFMSFGQFVSHDSILTESPPDTPPCCVTPNRNSPGTCYTVTVPAGDPSLPANTCLEGKRSSRYCPSLGGSREQTNMQTSFIDASQVYGPSITVAKSLREGRGGRLITGQNEWLPEASKVNAPILSTKSKALQFGAGDIRVNQNPGLTALHTLWMREHNRIANELRTTVAAGKQSWDDDKLFQESRRILIAEYSNIVFQEFLKHLLAPGYYSKLDLGDAPSTYSSSLDPTMEAHLPGAAFRMGHSMVSSKVNLAQKGKIVGHYFLKETFFRSSDVFKASTLANILEGLIYTENQEVDPAIVNDLSNHVPDFVDLIARNIMRGRDFGIPDYKKVRAVCKEPEFSFTKTAAENKMRPDAYEKLKQIYKNKEEDIDLFSGGLAEMHTLAGGTLGPTFSCIISSQYERLKLGDRFFFTHKDQKGSFTTAQIDNIKTRRLSDVICDNAVMESIPPNVMLSPTASGNTPVPCANRNKIDFNLYK